MKSLTLADMPGAEGQKKASAARAERQAAQALRLAALREKTFEELTSVERELLLKTLAVQCGMIRSSPDPVGERRGKK